MSILNKFALNQVPSVVGAYDAPPGTLLQLFDTELDHEVVALRCTSWLLIVTGEHAGKILHIPDDREVPAYDVTDKYDLAVEGGAPTKVRDRLVGGQVYTQEDGMFVCAADGKTTFHVDLSNCTASASPRREVKTILGRITAVQREMKNKGV